MQARLQTATLRASLQPGSPSERHLSASATARITGRALASSATPAPPRRLARAPAARHAGDGERLGARGDAGDRRLRRIEQEQRHERRPGRSRAGRGRRVRGGRRASPGRRAFQRARRRLRGDPPGRPLPAPARGVAHAGLAGPALPARHRALARAPRGRLPHLRCRRDVAAAAARAGPARGPRSGVFPLRRTRRPGRDRARHDRRGEGPLVPERPGQPRRRARGELSRCELHGERRRRRHGRRARLRRARQPGCDACGHRHHARRALAGAFLGIHQPARRGARGHARPRLHSCRGSVRRDDVRSARAARRRTPGERLTRAECGLGGGVRRQPRAQRDRDVGRAALRRRRRRPRARRAAGGLLAGRRPRPPRSDPRP